MTTWIAFLDEVQKLSVLGRVTRTGRWSSDESDVR